LLLVFAIPVLNLGLTGGFSKEKTYTKTEIKVLQETQPEPPKPKREQRTPERRVPNNRTPKAGPRFAMDLGVMGAGEGAVAPQEMVAAASGSGSGETGGVDSKPSIQGSPRFSPPQSIRDAEVDASLRLSFCVDAGGRAYDVRVVEERPPGMGLAQAGREALAASSFTPARKDGLAVPFCGLEQPFEVRFK
jgi:protein TonB